LKPGYLAACPTTLQMMASIKTITNSGKNQDDFNEPKLEITPAKLELAPGKLVLIQKQLLLLFHADQCKCEQLKKQCKLQYCAAMKGVIKHLKSCSHPPLDKNVVFPKCDFQYCLSSRLILTHWKNCKSGNSCLVCGPIKSFIKQQVKSDECQKRKSSDTQEDLQTKRQKTDVARSNELWTGTFYWHKQYQENKENKAAIEVIPMQCSLFSGNKQAQPVTVVTPPQQLQLDQAKPNCGHMKIIPTFFLKKSPGLLTNKMEHVLVKFKQNQQVEELKKLLASGEHCVYVHFSTSRTHVADGNLGISLILYYSAKINEFIGSIPINYQEFTNSLRALVYQVTKAKMNSS
jgi:hypothetical protein